jgi:NAD(P)-dependent dehydrogenase (short-subunit alcohol dehydrogenase family)
MVEKENKPRAVVITGGGTGIGRAMAETFVKNGDQVVIIGQREEVLRATAQAIGPNCTWQRTGTGCRGGRGGGGAFWAYRRLGK